MTQAKEVVPTIGRDFPGSGKCRLRPLSKAVNVNEISHQPPDNLARIVVSGEDWIQGFRFAAQ